ncbi:MAG TPA: glycosyltransferase [Candidatus Melainabacteria bacterium]|nr:glycosyltransferase [Candidatus Melainabacteria bacterium]
MGKLKTFSQRVLRRLRREFLGDNASPVSVVEDVFGYVTEIPFGQSVTIKDVPENTINWIVPDFGIGSGGHLNIFRMISRLQKLGFESRIIIPELVWSKSAADAEARINEHFLKLDAKVFVGREGIPSACFSFATAWTTSYYLRDFQSTVHKCYFVQDFEPFFYARSTESVLSEETYRFGFKGFAAGDWLASKLINEFAMDVEKFRFSYDKDRYFAPTEPRQATNKILFYSRPPTPRRGFELGYLALKQLLALRPDLEILMAGWDVSGYRLPKGMKNLGIVPLKDLRELYQQCDAALVLSFTNLSLVPLELMACGCPVVSNRGENVEWILNDEIATLAEPTVHGIVSALLKVIEDRAGAQAKADAALNYVQSTDWDTETLKLASSLRKMNERERQEVHREETSDAQLQSRI